MKMMGMKDTGHALRTENPIALRFLMTETLFNLEEAIVDSGRSDAGLPASAAAPLLEIPTSSPSGPVTSTNKNPELTFLGQNSSGFLFVFQDPSMPGQHRLPEAEMEAFEKILSALQLSLADVALINIAGSPGPTAEDLTTYFQPLKMVVLGTQTSLEGSQETWPELTLHQIYTPKIDSQSLEATTQVLHSYSFAEMMNDVVKKRTFWTQLKALLG